MDRVEATPGSESCGECETQVSTAECQTSVRRACIQCARVRAITADQKCFGGGSGSEI